MTNVPPNPPEPGYNPWGQQPNPQQPQPPYGPPFDAPQPPYGGYNYGDYNAGYAPGYQAMPGYEGVPPQPGNQQAYGYPPPPPGYPYPAYGYPQPPQKRGPGLWLLIGGLAFAVVLALVVGLALITKSESKPGQSAFGTSQASDDEAQIRQLMETLNASSTSDLSSAMQYFCSGDRKLLSSIGDLNQIDVPSRGGSSSMPVKVTDIEVHGNKATAHVATGPRAGSLYFLKEAGEWKFCMTSAPGFPR